MRSNSKETASNHFNKEHFLSFVSYFSNLEWYSTDIRAYLDHRIDVNKPYNGYITSNFSSSRNEDIQLRNKKIISFLDSRNIQLKWDFRMWIHILSYFDIACVIAAWWNTGDYRLYFQQFPWMHQACERFGFSPPQTTCTFASVYLDNSMRFKLYFRESLWKREIPSEYMLFEAKAEYWYIMQEYSEEGNMLREKAYLRTSGIPLNTIEIPSYKNVYHSIWEALSLDNVFVNYVAWDCKNPTEQSIYFVDERNHTISNSR